MAASRPIVAGLLGWMLLLEAATGNGREPPGNEQRPLAVGKSIALPTDAKASEDRKAAAAVLLEDAYKGERPPESVRMLAAILRGSQMGPGEGWFGPAETRYSWEWLAGRCGVDPSKGGIPRESFRGPEASFSRLDRNQDGMITPDDFDWSDRNPYVQMSKIAARLFKKLNAQANDGLTRNELLQFFDKAARGKDHLSADDFRDALLAGTLDSSKPNDPPSTPTLIRGFFAGDLGSMHEGPKLNERAPDFTLKTVDGKQTVQLSKVVGAKPVMLVFGSFT